MKVYPIFLNNLSEQSCLVIGGNHEAERKVEGLLECDANVTVVSPNLTDRLKAWASERRFTWHRRSYRQGDLKEQFLAIVSQPDPQTIPLIEREARREKVLLNAMDDVDHCTFVAGSVIRRGPLVISISTSGCAPAFSVRLRQRLEQAFDPECAFFLELLGSLRGAMAEKYPDFEERRSYWYELVDSDILPLLKEGDVDTALNRVREIAGAELPVSFMQPG